MPAANGIGMPTSSQSQQPPVHTTRNHQPPGRPLYRTLSRNSQVFKHDSTNPPRRQLSAAQLFAKPHKGLTGQATTQQYGNDTSTNQRPEPIAEPNKPKSQCPILTRPKGPVLTFKPQTVSMLDPTDLESMYSLWLVFSKCTEAIENGRRLENISWRLWNREMLFNSESSIAETHHSTTSVRKQEEAKQNSSNSSVPELHQVPKLSSSVESSASSCTTSSNQRGSNEKLQAARTSSPSLLPLTSTIQNASNTTHEASGRRRSKQLSTDTLRELLTLFNPNAKDDSLKPILARRQSAAKPPKLNDKNSGYTPNSLHSQDSITPQFSNTPVAPNETIISGTSPKILPSHLPSGITKSSSTANIDRSSSSLNVTRKQSSLFQHPVRTQSQLQNALTHKLATSKRNSQSSLAKLEPLKSSSAQGISNKPSPKRPILPQDSAQRLVGAPKDPMSRLTNNLATKSAGNLSQARASGIQRTTSSLFPNAPAKRPSLFSSSNQPSQEPSQKLAKNPSKDSSEEYSNSDTDADSSSSDFEGIDSNGSKLTYKHRTSTSTSIVRGFSPSSVSVAAISKGNRSSTQLPSHPSASRPAGSMLEMTKARPDKVPREKMFFIESSSPSESENGQNSLSSQSGFGSAPLKNSAESITSLVTADRHASLFSNPPHGASKTSSFSPDHRPSPKPLQAVSEHDDADDTDNDDDDDEYDDSDNASDDSAWDSVDDESDSGSFNESAFVRDDNKPKLLSRPSLLSSLFLNKPEKLMEEQRNKGGPSKSNRIPNSSESLPAQEPSTRQQSGFLASSASRPMSSLGKAARENTQTHNSSFTLHSPRTTRRNMFASELSDSVRRDLLWERKQTSMLNPMHTMSSSSQVGPSDEIVTDVPELGDDSLPTSKLVRRHTSADVAGLTRVRPPVTFTEPGESWKQDLDDESKGDFNYHARGW